jgi:microcystin-dependent protein
MAAYEDTRYDFDGQYLEGLVLVDTGTIVPWPTNSVPSGYLDCNGAAVSRSTYADLFAVIGTTYGSGDGSTTFNVPNMTSRIPVGKSNTKALASTGGANNANLNGVSINNTTISNSTMAAHTHASRVGGSNRNTGNNGNLCPTNERNSANNAGGSGSHNHATNAASASTVQPYIDINYVIKT